MCDAVKYGIATSHSRIQGVKILRGKRIAWDTQ